MEFGYARVSTKGQSLDRQIAALRTSGVDKIFREKVSGKSISNRPELGKAIDALGHGDVLVIAEWDRATRSMFDGINIIQRVAEREATVRALDKPWLDLSTPMGKGFGAFLSAMAEDERNRIVDRANAGRKLAKEEGKPFGPKFKLTEHQRELARERKANGERVRDIAKDYNVSHATIVRL